MQIRTDENSTYIFKMYSTPNSFKGTQIYPYLSLNIQNSILYPYLNTKIIYL